MATKIRLMRLGKIRAPYYRIVVADSRIKREGRVIETIGKYHPKQEPSLIEVDSERARYWLSVGAQPTEPVAAILKLTGDWQAHKGLPAPEKGVLTAAPREDRKAVFEAVVKETMDAAEKPAKKTAAKKAPAKAAAKKTAEKPAEATEAVEKPAADAEAAKAPAEAPVPAAEETAPAAEEAAAAEAEAPAEQAAPVADASAQAPAEAAAEPTAEAEPAAEKAGE